MKLNNSTTPLIATVLLTAALLLASNKALGEAAKDCSSKACFEPTITRFNETIPLYSSALFTYLFFDVYSLALYAESAAGKVSVDTPHSLVFHYHREIKKEDMINGAQKNLEENPEVDPSRYQAELQQINTWYVDVKAGDRYELNYIPEKGLSLYLNDKLLGTIKSSSVKQGRDFARDYFGIWLSKYPLSKELRDKLLKK